MLVQEAAARLEAQDGVVTRLTEPYDPGSFPKCEP